ncbi:MAG: hypothetical protein IPP82_04990 [Xanthomonadales bacterium]|nr:hypothetical protein [Xanthomonadales bacterium]
MKLLRHGLYSEVEQRLFRRERKALASLSHPNIARLIDGGVSETGIPGTWCLNTSMACRSPISSRISGLAD